MIYNFNLKTVGIIVGCALMIVSVAGAMALTLPYPGSKTSFAIAVYAKERPADAAGDAMRVSLTFQGVGAKAVIVDVSSTSAIGPLLIIGNAITSCTPYPGTLDVLRPRAFPPANEPHAVSVDGQSLGPARAFSADVAASATRHLCTLALNPKEANNAQTARGVLELLPRYLEKDGVVAVGEIGFDDMTPAEDRIFAEQLVLAKEHGLPALIHTPHRDKKRGTERSIALIRETGFPEHMALIDHNNEITLPLVLASGCWAAHSIYPGTKMDEARMLALVKEHGTDRILINSAADWGISDPLKVPKTAALMRESGIDEASLEKLFWTNPVDFFAQSGRIDRAEFGLPAKVDQREMFQGNSVLRGQTPVVR